MPTVIVCSRFAASPTGHGGNHRSYQIKHDLEKILGKDNVISFCLDGEEHHLTTTPTTGGFLRRRIPSEHFVRRFWRAIAAPGKSVLRFSRRLQNLRRNPFGVFVDTDYMHFGAIPQTVIEQYGQMVENISQPVISIMEHVDSQGDLVKISQNRGIPTISCLQNLESLDTALINWSRRISIYAACADLADELNALAQCTRRLFISRVETSLVQGLGLSADYYPYMPVGIIRDRLLALRRRREAAKSQRKIFLVLGSAIHNTTRRSIEWLTQNIRTYGLPPGVKVLVIGAGTEQTLKPGENIAGLEFYGWLEQDKLEELLVAAQAVLLPQHMGFGAVTRLSEMACAGIPCITFNHPLYSIDSPPGIFTADMSWSSWETIIREMSSRVIDVSAEEYTIWENRRCAPLSSLLVRELENLMK